MESKNRIFNFFKDKFILDTAIVFVGASLVGFFNLLYHLISVRLLAPQDYGTFNALISLIMFASMTFSPLGTALTRFFTEYITKRDFATLTSIFMKLIKRLLIAGVLAFLFFFVISPPLARFLKTQIIYTIICGGIIALSLFSLPVPSLFQSLQKFKTYSFIGIFSTFGKLIFGAFLMFLGWGVLGGLLGFLIAPILIILVTLFFIPNIFKKEIGYTYNQVSVKASLIPIYKYFPPVSIAILSFTLLTNIDVVLVKHFFSPLDAGYYSIAQMVGKILLFLPSALAIVIFPKSTASYVNNSHSNKLLYKSLVLAGLLCGITSIFCFLFPDFILSILTAKSNPASSGLVGLFSLAMSFYALLWITVNFLLATHNLKFVLPLLFIAILETIFIYNYHSTLIVVLYILLIFSFISFFVSLFCGKKSKVTFSDWRPSDQKVYISDISKIKKQLNWQPIIGPKEGVRKIIEWVKKNITIFS